MTGLTSAAALTGTDPSAITSWAGSAPNRAAQHADRTVRDRQAGPERGQHRRELGHRLADLWFERPQHGVRIAQLHELAQPAGELAPAVHRQV